MFQIGAFTGSGTYKSGRELQIRAPAFSKGSQGISCSEEACDIYAQPEFHLRASFVTPGTGTGGTASEPNSTFGGIRSMSAFST